MAIETNQTGFTTSYRNTEKFINKLQDLNQQPSVKSSFSREMVEKLLEAGYSKIDIAAQAKISLKSIERVLSKNVELTRYKTFCGLLRLYCLALIKN